MPGYALANDGSGCNGERELVLTYIYTLYALQTSIDLLIHISECIGVRTHDSDINECLTNNGGCGHNCTNMEGSFICFCASGYALAMDGLSCTGKLKHVCVVTCTFVMPTISYCVIMLRY